MSTNLVFEHILFNNSVFNNYLEKHGFLMRDMLYDYVEHQPDSEDKNKLKGWISSKGNKILFSPSFLFVVGTDGTVEELHVGIPKTGNEDSDLTTHLPGFWTADYDSPELSDELKVRRYNYIEGPRSSRGLEPFVDNTNPREEHLHTVKWDM